MMRATRQMAVGVFCGLVGVAPAWAQLQVTVYVSGLNSPVAMIQDPSNASRQYVVEQGGQIKVIQNGVVAATPFLNLGASGLNVVQAGGEQGLLGLAFPGDYATSGRFYVNFTRRPDGFTVIARFKRSSGNPLVADPASRFDLQWPGGLRYIVQPASNHNGGNLRFGPDGYLYIGLGDGGGGGDQFHNAQNPNTLLGKMLRIDVSVPDGNTKGYQVPPDNPFLDSNPVAALGEIWAFGYRNPWRYSFDSPALGGTGALVVGDVGQSNREEIDYEPAGVGGRNYGWPSFEGFATYPGDALLYGPAQNPIYDYPRSYGQAVAGGYVYRGTLLGASYQGRYFFADYQARKVGSLALTINPTTHEATASGFVDHTGELGGSDFLGFLSSVDIDSQGEIYFSSLDKGVIYKLGAADGDGDGLPTAWEVQFGLDPASAAGINGASGDPDGDGRTNIQEYNAGTHPRNVASLSRYFAEGATSAFFDTRFALFNPGTSTATVLLRFLTTGGGLAPQVVSLPAKRRATVNAKSLAALQSAEFATELQTDQEVVLDRTMSWDANGYGSHAETALPSPSTTWYFAEGATHSGFDLFYLFENPSASQSADVQVRFLLPAGAPVVKSYTVPPSSRFNIWVDTIPELVSTDVSAQVTSTNGVPIIAERAMYLSAGGQLFTAGHESAGVTNPATSWFLAEGATGPFFDEFILISNPGSTPANVTVTYLRAGGGPVARTYPVAANSRFNIWVDTETIGGVSLADVAVSAAISSTQPVVVERAMWWPGSIPTWTEAHNSFGARAAGTRWALAEGEEGGSADVETYVLIANTSAFAGSASVTIYFEDGSSAGPLTVQLPASSRTNVPIRSFFPTALGRRFGAIVQSLGGTPAQLVVERAMYSDAGGVTWAAGTDALATRLQ